MKVTAEEFREEILRQIKEGNGESHEIRAGDVVRDLGDRLRRRGENANCCGAMRTLFRPGDRIIRLPKKRIGLHRQNAIRWMATHLINRLMERIIRVPTS
jgi:hypothetical protein